MGLGEEFFLRHNISVLRSSVFVVVVALFGWGYFCTTLHSMQDLSSLIAIPAEASYIGRQSLLVQILLKSQEPRSDQLSFTHIDFYLNSVNSLPFPLVNFQRHSLTSVDLKYIVASSNC